MKKSEKNGNVSKVVDYLYHQILSGERPLGSPISEMAVADALNMSRSPVREGIKLLEERGILIHYPNRGTVVVDFTYDDICEIFELRITFEMMGLKHACQYMGDEQIQRLKHDIEALNENSTAEEYYAANTALHQAIVEYSGNKRMIHFYEIMSLQIALVNRVSAKLPGHFEESKQKHLAILSALEAHDYETARQRLSEHLEEVKNNTLKMYL